MFNVFFNVKGRDLLLHGFYSLYMFIHLYHGPSLGSKLVAV